MCVCRWRWRSGLWLCLTSPVRLKRICPSTRGALIRVIKHIDTEWRRGRLEGREGSYPAAFTQPHQGTTHTHTHTHGTNSFLSKCSGKSSASNSYFLLLFPVQPIPDQSAVKGGGQGFVWLHSGERGRAHAKGTWASQVAEVPWSPSERKTENKDGVKTSRWWRPYISGNES